MFRKKRKEERTVFFRAKIQMNELSEKVKELLAAKKISALHEMLHDMNPADIAELLSDIDDERDLLLLFRILPKEIAADTFVMMDSDMMESLLEAFSDRELSVLIEDMYLDDAVDVIEEMPANVARRLLSRASAETRREINALHKYPHDSAGSILTTEYIRLYPETTVDEAFGIIRDTGIDKETVYTCYVTDHKRKLVGVISALSMMLAKGGDLIGDIMESNVISVRTTDDKEFVANQLQKYDFLALPVVDSEDRMIGIVTIDDAVDVIVDEYSEDIEIMAAITPTDKPYLKQSVFSIWKSRIPWLLLLMISATFTGMIISSFEDALAAQVALTAFIPMLMDTGGNSGSQSSVTIIRGISLSEISFSDIFAVMWKELRISAMCGVCLSAATFVKIMLVDNLILQSNVSILVASVVCMTLLVTVVCAKLIGCTLPLFAKKLGFDPAVMASPFITTIVDAVSLLVYFAFAKLMLGL